MEDRKTICRTMLYDNSFKVYCIYDHFEYRNDPSV